VVRTIVDRPAHVQLTTEVVAAQDAFAYWREMICATFVRLAAEPVDGAGAFRGLIEHVPVGDVELSTVIAGSQHVTRTPRLISQEAADDFLLASIQLSGRGLVEQDGRIAALEVGEMAFYDSTRPYALHFEDPFHQLVVQVPKRDLMLRDTRELTARTLGAGTPGPVVATFFGSLAESAKAQVDARVLVPHAVGLLSAAAACAGRLAPTQRSVDALTRQAVIEFLSRNLADPTLDAAVVAKACHVSRRTLYRMAGEEGIAARLRRLRIERAKALLLIDDRPIGSVAAACGFETESGFHRAFRAATDETPAEYRRRHGTTGQ
jgi:AraC-like DNA-binding protein